MMTEEIRVTTTSYETLVENGWDASHDDGAATTNYYSRLTAGMLKQHLTNKQQIIIVELLAGKERSEIASNLMISEQAVHQIVIRIRRRLNQRAGIPLKGWKRRHGGL